MKAAFFVAACLMMAGGALLAFGDGGGVIASGDVLDKCYRADREARVNLLFSLASKEFPNDSEKLDWWNTEIDKASQQAMRPFIDTLAESIVAGTVEDLARELEQM
jgi:glutamate synthase domain-containing protein 3